MPKFERILVAPCGMDCNIYSHYLAYAHDPQKIPGRPQCAGCRIRNKNCAFVKKRCAKLRKGEAEFCYECTDFPCRSIKKLDERYRARWNYSFIENLECIRDEGIDAFLEKEQKRFKCPKCRGTVSVHDGKCYACETAKGGK